jgi:hypothetical protein
MIRNKRTDIIADIRLTPLTERILAKMGRKGAIIRRRIRRFYEERALSQDYQVNEEPTKPV